MRQDNRGHKLHKALAQQVDDDLGATGCEEAIPPLGEKIEGQIRLIIAGKPDAWLRLLLDVSDAGFQVAGPAALNAKAKNAATARKANATR